MGTQVTYKGGQLASFTNDTRILKTAGKYMEDDVTIVDDAGEASAIVITDEPDSHGGTIRHINAVVLTGDTVIPQALLSGYTAHDGTGQAIVGTYTPQGATLGSKTITVNGTYNAINDQLDGYSQVNVNVTPSLQAKTATPTESQQSITPDTGYVGLSSVTINAISDTYVGSAINRRSSSDLGVSGASVSVPAGYYASAASKSIPSGSATTPATTITATPTISVSASGLITATASATKSVTPTVSAGYVSTGTAGTITVNGSKTSQLTTQAATTITPTTSSQQAVAAGVYTTGIVTVNAIPSEYVIPAGTKTITSNGTGIDVANYANVNVAVPGDSPVLQAKTNISPIESSQTIEPDDGYDALSSVQINAISSTYVGSEIDRRDSTDLTASGATVSVPAGYYATATSKSITSGTAGTPTATKGTVSNHSISVAPSVTNTTGYITGGTKTGTAVTVSASELVSGSTTITANDTGIDVTNYASVDVAVPGPNLQAKTGITPTESSQTIEADSAYDGLSSVQINAISSTYVGSGITRRDSSSLSASGPTVTVPAGYYAAQETKTVTTMTLPTSTSASATSGYTSKATVSRSTSDQYINIAPGYNSAGGYYKISAVANGSVTAPASISGTSASVSTGTNTLTLTKTVSVTPNVTTAGYISSGTAGNSSVSLTASVTTKAAATITPTKSTQTIASGTYLTGTQTIAAIPAAYQDVTSVTATASDVVSGKTIVNSSGTVVNGTLVIQHYYTGSSAPSSSTGVDGDIYLQTS